LMFTILLSALYSGTALFFHWWNAYTVLFTISRRLRILEKKIVACQERMNKRAFSDALIGKLAHAANFDFTAAQKEADTLLNSMMKGGGGGDVGDQV
uniref:Uncharacterized protein n=1 Tax=Panagrolaimus sp. PS1159 TaxID=55785 RepID=A0AC35GXG2_9BILA